MPISRSVLAGKPQHAAGKRIFWVTIQSSPVPTGGSFPDEEWTDLQNVWMARDEQAADERFAASQESAFSDTVWTSPYIPTLDEDLVDVTARRRLKLVTEHDGEQYERIFNIRSAKVRGSRQSIELHTLAQSGVTLVED